MARQADRFGQAGLARAAEIVSTGLDQMRGATSPRLLLELTCAQVLLPAATTDEKSLLARLERLEKGTPSTVPQSPPRPPHSSPGDDAERSRVPSLPRTGGSAPPSPPGPPARPAPARAEPARAARPPARPAPDSPEPAPQAARPAPEPARPAPEAVRVPAAAPSRPAPIPAAAGSSAADTLRQSWDAILDAVMRERKVAWLLLRNASVLSLEDGVLTLRFPREGDLKGFNASPHDAVLKRVLSSDFGLNVTIKGVAAGDVAAQTGRPGTGASAAARPPAVRRDPVPAPSEAAPPEFAGPEFAGPYDEPDDMPPGGSHEDEPSPDDRAVRNAELTGMDLIQRELGGQVIGEFEG
jgi:DNA polymerase-3 subunit gamma/tau